MGRELFLSLQFGIGLIFLIPAGIFGILVWWATIWAIKQKGRSLFHLFWLLLPFGFVALLILRNKREALDIPSG